MKQIMGNTTIPQAHKMKYLNEWQQAKRTGAMPKASGDSIKGDMSLVQVLTLMEKKAEQAMQSGVLFPKWGKAISGLAGRRIWVVPADQTPSCETIPEDETAEAVDVRFMARLEIPLKE